MTNDQAISILTIDDPSYPSLLRHIHHPPAKLYVRGSLQAFGQPNRLAVVGSRRANHYGRQAVKLLLPAIARAGITIVSGIAFGIDALAHHIAVEAGQPTIAVLGSGLDNDSLYPHQNLPLAQRILAEGGLLMSEYPPGTKALLYHFPARNRIIAGLCQVTLIIQAAHKSGSLITARLALESNREVCAVPGSITDPFSSGTNQLIHDGATPIVQAQDIATLYNIILATTPTVAPPKLSPEQTMVYTCLTTEPLHLETLLTRLQQPTQRISAILLELELLGLIEHIGGLRYIRR